MKPTPLVADEMFPEGAGRYLAFEMVTENMEEIVSHFSLFSLFFVI